MKDALGDRIKSNFEDRTRYYLPRRTYSILRIDGCHFHTYTKGLKRPFDIDLINDMNNAIVAMLPQLQGVAFAYTQSDEISILLTDFEKENTSAWFDGNLQKMCSVAASIITAEFNACRLLRQFNSYVKHCDDVNFANSAYFDCRVFTIPDRIEVINYFRWRQQDCIRNSLSMVAQSNFSHEELHGKSQSNMHDMLHAKDVNWATDYTDGEKNGRIIVKEEYIPQVQEWSDLLLANPNARRTRWVANGAWVFSKDEGKLLNTIPKYE
jgi:tRNA(His) 5'-end guanylyltransferase